MTTPLLRIACRFLLLSICCLVGCTCQPLKPPKNAIFSSVFTEKSSRWLTRDISLQIKGFTEHKGGAETKRQLVDGLFTTDVPFGLSVEATNNRKYPISLDSVSFFSNMEFLVIDDADGASPQLTQTGENQLHPFGFTIVDSREIDPGQSLALKIGISPIFHFENGHSYTLRFRMGFIADYRPGTAPDGNSIVWAESNIVHFHIKSSVAGKS